jgi:uncharacterized protein (DUF302 family)
VLTGVRVRLEKTERHRIYLLWYGPRGEVSCAECPTDATFHPDLAKLAPSLEMKTKGTIMETGNNGISHITTAKSVKDVLAHLLSLLQTKRITVFAVVDHSGEAAKVGMEMHDTKLVIFGNPRAGTPAMLAAPDCALDLPLKILIAEGPDGRTKISYNSPAFLQTRYGLEPDFAKPLAAIEQIAAALDN